MATADTFLKTGFFSGLALLLRRPTRTADPRSDPHEEDTRARRAFILEMMEMAPDAFGSEEATRGAGLYFSGRF